MFLRPILTTVILCYCLYGCDTSAKKEENVDHQGIYNENLHQNYERHEANHYYFGYRTFSEKEGQCSDNCAEVFIQYPVFDDSKNDGFNQIVSDQINQELADFTLSKSPSAGKDELARAFIVSYQEFKAEFPEVQTPWTVEISIEVTFKHATFLSASNSTTAYTGGAHPLNSRKYINITRDGKRITSLDFFVTDQAKLTELAEKQFRAQQNIPPKQNLSDAGFSFENDRFYLPENYGFNENGIVFYYNSYEIASYAQGPTELVIPYSVLEGICKFLPQS